MQHPIVRNIQYLNIVGLQANILMYIHCTSFSNNHLKWCVFFYPIICIYRLLLLNLRSYCGPPVKGFAHAAPPSPSLLLNNPTFTETNMSDATGPALGSRDIIQRQRTEATLKQYKSELIWSIQTPDSRLDLNRWVCFCFVLFCFSPHKAEKNTGPFGACALMLTTPLPCSSHDKHNENKHTEGKTTVAELGPTWVKGAFRWCR